MSSDNPHFFHLQHKKDKHVWLHTVRDTCPKVCVYWLGHTEWVWMFVWMHLSACTFRTLARWKRETGSQDILPGKVLFVFLSVCLPLISICQVI